MTRYQIWIPALVASVSLMPVTAGAQDDGARDAKAAELAKKLANPLAALISVPMQYNNDEYGGANDGAEVSRLNV